MNELLKLWCEKYRIIYRFDCLTDLHYFKRIYEENGEYKGNLFSISNRIIENTRFKDLDIILLKIKKELKLED